MDKITKLFKEHKYMIIAILLFSIIFSIVNIFDVFDLSDGIKNIVELISIIFAFYSADKSRINANESKNSAVESLTHAKYIKQIRDKAVSEALNIEKDREKEKQLYVKILKDKEKILSEIDKSLIFLKGDEDKAEKHGLEFVSLSRQFQTTIQHLGAHINYYESILDKDIVVFYKNIDALVKQFLKLDRVKSLDDENWTTSETFQIGENLSNMKVYFTNMGNI